MPPDYGEWASRLNEYAGRIASPADALRLVDCVAHMCGDQLPSAFTRSSLRKRVSSAEYAAVSDPRKLIPKHRLAAAWNEYARTIKAPEEFLLTEPDIHFQRDALWTMARVLWSAGHQNVWAVPTLFATRPDGSLAAGCRPIEAFRILWNFANMRVDLEGMREEVAKGVLVSDSFPKPSQEAKVLSGRTMVSSGAYADPMRDAQRQYVKDHGKRAWNAAIFAMIEGTLG